MTQSSLWWWRVLVLSTVVLCIGFAVRASGQEKKPGGFATVDVGKLLEQYKTRQVMISDLRALETKFAARLARRDNMPLLTEEEHKLLDQLNEKEGGQTADDKKKIQELTEKAQKLSNELQALRQKPSKDLTDADKARLAELERALANAQQQFASLKDDLSNTAQQESGKRQEALTKAIKEAVAKVAEQKGLSIVFTTDVALYAGIDITAPVLAELNKK